MSSSSTAAAAAAVPAMSCKSSPYEDKASWLAVAASVAGVVAGSASLALCEQQQQQQRQNSKAASPASDDQKFQRFRTEKHGIWDPMTSYAKYAIERELKEEEHDHHQDGEEVSQEEQEEVADKEAEDPAEQLVHATSVAAQPAPPAAVDLSSNPGMTKSEARIEEATRKAKQHSGGLKIFSGNGNMSLALEVCRHLGVNLGKATVGKFADGEVNVVIHENVRGKDVYVVQPTGPPVNDNIMELLLMVSTLRRSSARRITVVIPYYGYARQDRKMQVSY